MNGTIKVLHTADWHIGQYKGPMVNGVNARFIDIQNCLEDLVRQASIILPDLVVISGDVFNQAEVQAKRVSSEVLLAENTIRKLSDIARDVIVLRGTPNHDGLGQIQLLAELFKDIHNVHVVTAPAVIETASADIACVPGFDKGEFRAKFPGLSSEEENRVWTEEISKIILGLRMECKPGIPAILSAHYTTPGANTESGQSSFFANFEPIIPSTALHNADFDAVMLGHIHRPQKVYGLKNVFYSGAVNALNFNDEGQDRGFYVHEFDGSKIVNSAFHVLPYRQFKTLKWTADDVTEYLRSPDIFIADHHIYDLVEDRIVRVHYQCTPEQKQAIGIPALQAKLYELGAFYVAELEADTDTEITNKDLLSEESDPLTNLKRWLDEKKFPDPDEIAELGEPIIRQAQMLAVTSKVAGVFKPVHIAVKNYRNYEQAEFDFGDVSFCTINGQNGAGKSSLFMDAIIDALYEEPREGDLKGWIRGTEDARSGSIEFIFDIGESRFRVTRTRVKSGKATLNLSQFEDGEWKDRSKERFADTQQTIIDTIGMDSITFRSCALIMQDQYGLFLEAKKEDRVAVLANLLGLGVYGIMEQIARDKLGELKRALAAAREDIKVHNDQISTKGNPEKELADLEEMLANLKEQEETLSAKYELLKEKEAAYKRLQDEYMKASKARMDAENAVADDKKILTSLDEELVRNSTALAEKPKIIAGANAYREADAACQRMYPDVVRKNFLTQQLEDKRREQERMESQADQIDRTIKSYEAQIADLRKQANLPDDIVEKLSELAKARDKMEEGRSKQEQVTKLQMEFFQEKSKWDAKVAEAETKIRKTREELERCKEQRMLIRSSGCPVIDREGGVSCKFLAKAQEDSDRISELERAVITAEGEAEGTRESEVICIEQYTKKQEAIGYQAADYADAFQKIKELEQYERMQKQQDAVERAVSRLEGMIVSGRESLTEYQQKASEARSAALSLAENVNRLSETAKQYDEAAKRRDDYKAFVAKETELPVLEERSTNLSEKIGATEEKLEKDKMLLDRLTSEVGTIMLEIADYDPLLMDIKMKTEIALKDNRNRQERLNITKGSLTQKIDDIERLRGEIATLQATVDKNATLAVRYEALKRAFSQDGVPHQIIRNIIPHIADTANAILGSMTGGTMGVEFVLDKVIKGSGNEKATLDVLIDEYGKTKLPYAAKSGGEKVKSSLAIILALSEIKASAAGIQIGMLFIDEPPFLDSEGTQAYVDSLEAIRKRYPDIKIMAITHDDEFKARFSQSVTVFKDDEGSHVRWD